MAIQLGESLRRRRPAGGGGPFPRWSPRGSRLAFAATGLGVAGLLAGYLFATRLLFPAPAPPPDLDPVPDVIGLQLQEASGRIADAELVPEEVDFLRHPVADSGQVIAQSPLPGQLARPGSAVRITVSLGPERSAVPDVLGLRREWAANVLEASGFAVEVDSTESSRARGLVVSVEPAPGSELPIPGDVRILVSTGPAQVAMPALVGMTEEAARDTLQSLGLDVSSVDEVFRFGRDQGIVVEQAPPADSLLQPGTSVRLSVGRR